MTFGHRFRRQEIGRGRAERRGHRSQIIFACRRPTTLAAPSGRGALPPFLGLLSEQVRLQGEDVVEHAIHTPTLEPVLHHHARMLELKPQARTERTVDPLLALHLGLLKDLKAPVEPEQTHAVLALAHIPKTSTRPADVMRTFTVSSGGSG